MRMIKKTIILLLIIFSFTTFSGCATSNNIDNNYSHTIVEEKEYYWDTGGNIGAVDFNIKYSGRSNITYGSYIFTISIFNYSYNPVSINPNYCTIISSDGRTFTYNYNDTYSLSSGIDSFHKVNPGGAYFTKIAFDLPSGWQTDKYRFRIKYPKNDYLIINMWNNQESK